MKKSDLMLIYGGSFLGAAFLSYYTGKRGRPLLKQAAWCSLISGSAIVVLGVVVKPAPPARKNGWNPWAISRGPRRPGAEGMGKLSKKGVAVLEAIDTSTLYAPMNKDGVKIEPVPEKANVITQEA